MIKELEELTIDRAIAAKACGLIEEGYKYNKKVDDDPLCPERFYCRVDNFKPDTDWNHFFYVKNRVAKGKNNIILSEDHPKESFKLLMQIIK
jgi:hypothetical protein